MSDDIVERLHSLSQELAGLQDDIGDKFVIPNEAAAEISRLREALKFYADESNHLDYRPGYVNTPIIVDRGYRARTALEGTER